MPGNPARSETSLRWLVLLTVMVGTFLGRLDQSIVNLALPRIINDFDITVDAAGWIATAYIIANAVFVPIWGKLGDTIGRKKVYIIGFSLFIFGSLLCGIAWNLGSMILFRVIQAIASSADYPTAMAIVAVTFKEGRERAQALGIWSSSFAVATIFGPLLGGPLIDTFGWRSVFLINIPVGLLGLWMAAQFVHESVSETKTRSFDWWGAITLGTVLSSLVLVLDKGNDWGWLSQESLISYAVIVVFFALFITIEKRVKVPIVDLHFFKIPAFVYTLINNFVVFMGMMGSVFLIPIFAQVFLGYNATESGYLFIPLAFGFMLSSPLGGALTGRVQPRYIIFWSTLVASVGIFFLGHLDARSSALDIMAPLTLMAFGLGFGMSQRTTVVASVVDPREIGVASSVLALVRNIAGAVGIALFATILNNRVERNIFSINALSTIVSTNPAVLKTYTGLIELKAQIDAYNYVFLVSSIVVFLGAFLSLTIKVRERRGQPQVEMVMVE